MKHLNQIAEISIHQIAQIRLQCADALTARFAANGLSLRAASLGRDLLVTPKTWVAAVSLQESVAGVSCKISLECQVQTDCRHATFRSACSRPVTEGYRLLVGNVAMTSMTVAPALELERSFSLTYRSRQARRQRLPHRSCAFDVGAHVLGGYRSGFTRSPTRVLT